MFNPSQVKAYYSVYYKTYITPGSYLLLLVLNGNQLNSAQSRTIILSAIEAENLNISLLTLLEDLDEYTLPPILLP